MMIINRDMALCSNAWLLLYQYYYYYTYGKKWNPAQCGTFFGENYWIVMTNFPPEKGYFPSDKWSPIFIFLLPRNASCTKTFSFLASFLLWSALPTPTRFTMKNDGSPTATSAHTFLYIGFVKIIQYHKNGKIYRLETKLFFLCVGSILPRNLVTQMKHWLPNPIFDSGKIMVWKLAMVTYYNSSMATSKLWFVPLRYALIESSKCMARGMAQK